MLCNFHFLHEQVVASVAIGASIVQVDAVWRELPATPFEVREKHFFRVRHYYVQSSSCKIDPRIAMR
jgi:hypothetical protein